MDNSICLNDILDGLSIKLNSIFGDNYSIYTNDAKQGFEMPCFFIKQMPEIRTKQVGTRYRNTVSFVIHVFLEAPTIEDLNTIGHELYQLELLELSNKGIIRGTGMKTEIVDNVLEFFIDYDFFVFKETDEDEIMNTISINEEVNNG